MHDLSVHLCEHVLPKVPIRQWVLSPPHELAALLAVRPKVLSHLIRSFLASIDLHHKVQIEEKDRPRAKGGAVTFVQRFTQTLTLFPHLHVLALDGIYLEDDRGALEFIASDAPHELDLLKVGRTVFQKMERYLLRHGYLNEEHEPTTELERWWIKATKEPSLLQRQAPSNKKLLHAAQYGGFSIHAGVKINGDDERGREKLVQYAARPAFCEQQLRMVDDDKVELRLRKPTKAGQKLVVFEAVRFLRRLAWLIPPPMQNLVRYSGILGPAAKRRKEVIPNPKPLLRLIDKNTESRSYRVPWARLLKKVFDLDAERCPDCNGPLRAVGAVTKASEIEAYLRQGVMVLGQDARAPPDAA